MSWSITLHGPQSNVIRELESIANTVNQAVDEIAYHTPPENGLTDILKHSNSDYVPPLPPEVSVTVYGHAHRAEGISSLSASYSVQRVDNHAEAAVGTYASI